MPTKTASTLCHVTWMRSSTRAVGALNPLAPTQKQVVTGPWAGPGRAELVMATVAGPLECRTCSPLTLLPCVGLSATQYLRLELVGS